MANEFKVKNGLIVIGDLTTSGTITINGALAATQSWVTSQAYLTSASLSGYATQSYVTSALAALVDAAPAALDTLNELAAALGDDANFSTTITNSIASKLSLTGGTLTGALNGTSASFSSNVTLGNNADLVFQDLAGTFPTSGKGFDWTLNNDGARIYAIQPNSDSIDFVFQLRDNATTNDRFVFWVAEWQGPAYDKYPLIISGGTQFDLKDSALYTNTVLRLSNSGVLQNVTGNISMFTNNAGYLTSYSETDTLQSVTNRGGTTTNRVEFQYSVDRYSQAWRNTSTGAYWWVTTDSDKLGLHLNGDGDKFYFSNTGDFYSTTNGWLSTALAAKQNASTAINTSNIASQSVSYATSAGSAGYVTNQSGQLASYDNRTISPSETNASYLQFGFTSWGNNNSAPYADYLHLRSYPDSSGGSDNLVMFLKSGIGMRIYQQTFGSASAYSSYADVWHSGNLTNLNQLTNGPGYITASALSPYLPLAGGTMSGILTFSSAYNAYIYTFSRVGLANQGRIIYNNGTGSNMFFGELASNVYGFTPNAYTDTPALAFNFSTNNVGIGTASPLFNLQVGSNAGTIATTTIRLQNSYLDTNGYYGFNIDAVDNGVSGHDLRFLGRSSPTGAFSELVRIKNTGNVGIGISSPAYKLDVNGETRLGKLITTWSNSPISPSAVMYSESGYNTVFAGNGQFSTSYLALMTTGNMSYMGGNIGIGTTSPGSKLTVYSDTTADGILVDVLSRPRITLRDRGNSDTIIGTGDYGLDDFFIDTYSGNALAIKGSTRNVGIGTSSPNEKLHVAGNINAYVNGGIDAGLFASTSAGSTTIALRSNGITHFNGGSVGIGTFSPTDSLSVQGNTNLGNSYGSTTSSTYTTRVSGYAMRYDASNRYGNYGVLILNADSGWTGSARRFMITNGLNVNKFAIIRSVDSTTDPSFGDGGAISSGTADFVIDSAGNVGIGTTTPGYKLDINGNSRTTGIHYVDTYLVTPYIYGGGPITMGNDVIIDSTSAWNASAAMLNVGGTGDGRIQVRHIYGKSAESAAADHLWLQYQNTGNHVQIGAGSEGNNLYVSGNIYMNGYFGGNLVATQSWVNSQGFLTSVSDIWVNTAGDTMTGSLSFSEASVIKKRFTTGTNNPVKTASGVLTSRSDNGGGSTYYIIETNVPQDDYQMGGFTIEIFGNYSSTNHKTKIDLGGYWNPEPNGGFIGFEAHGSNPQYKPTIEVARNTSGKTVFIIYGVSWNYPVIVARDLWLGYTGTDGGAYGEGWSIIGTSDISSYVNRDTVVWRNAYSDSNPAGYITGYSETDTLQSVTSRGSSTNTGLYINNNNPTLYLQDTDHRSAMIHVNSDYFYILNGAGTNSTGWAQQANSRWLFMGNLNNNDITFGGSGDFAGTVTASGGNSSNWNTAYGWGNHASAGYLTSVTAHTQAWSTITSTPTTISGYGITNAYTDAQIQNFFNGANAISGYNKSNWDTAYSWGNHASAGYALNSSLANYLPLSGGVIGGGVTINGNLTVNGTITENSSLKLKENVETSEGNLEKVVNLRPVTYNKIGSQTKELGLIAEEVAEVYPEFVQYDENGEPVGVHYSRLTAALIGAVKELTNQVQELNKKING